MKKLAAIGAGILVIGMVISKEEVASTKPPSSPLESVFDEYRKTDLFEIPEGAGHTEDEKKKWSLLRDVITCESASRWVITEVPEIGWDVGPCQTQTKYHLLAAARMNLDLMEPTQNMRYCIALFEKYHEVMQSGKGWHPWKATQECWQERQQIRKMEAKR